MCNNYTQLYNLFIENYLFMFQYEDGKRCVIRGISKDSESYQQTKLNIVGTEECLQGSNVYR